MLAVDQALLLERTRSIHTFGMRFPIAAVQLDRDLVVRSVRPVRPGKLLLPGLGIRHVLECAIGVDLRPGDRLQNVRTDCEARAGGRYTSRRCPRAGGGVRRDRAPIV
jgi:hypothetical protein